MIVKTEQDEIQNYLVDASNTKGFCDAVFIAAILITLSIRK